MTVPSRCYILPLLALAAAFIAPGRAADAPAPVAPAADTTLSRFDRLAAAGVPVIAITGRPAGWSEGFAQAWPVAASSPTVRPKPSS